MTRVVIRFKQHIVDGRAHEDGSHPQSHVQGKEATCGNTCCCHEPGIHEAQRLSIENGVYRALPREGRRLPDLGLLRLVAFQPRVQALPTNVRPLLERLFDEFIQDLDLGQEVIPVLVVSHLDIGIRQVGVRTCSCRLLSAPPSNEPLPMRQLGWRHRLVVFVLLVSCTMQACDGPSLRGFARDREAVDGAHLEGEPRLEELQRRESSSRGQ